MLLAIALYLFDSALLLSSDEALVLRGWRSRWFADFGANRWRLAGKEPYLPNPLTPHFPLFRLTWRFEAPSPEVTVGRRVFVPDELAYFYPFVYISFACLFVLLPIALFMPVGTAFTLSVIGVLYVNNFVALTVLFRFRTPLHLSSRQFSSIAFECLVCPPLSVNLIRKLCAKMTIHEDFIAATSRLMLPEDLAMPKTQCLNRIDEQIAYEAEGTARMQALILSRDRFITLESQ